jgi:hypothetical protein
MMLRAAAHHGAGADQSAVRFQLTDSRRPINMHDRSRSNALWDDTQRRSVRWRTQGIRDTSLQITLGVRS